MKIRQLLWKELLHRKGNSLLALALVTSTVALIVGALLILEAYRTQTELNLEAYRTRTEQQIAKLDDEIRKITKNLGFNIYVLPREQNLADFYANDFGEKTMSQSLVQRLADSKDIVTIQHLRPALIRKIDWPEQNLQMILMGVSGVVPWTHRKNSKIPLAEAVPPGRINIGHVLADQAGLKVGNNLVLRGETFSVQEIYEPRGTKDDITAWIDLATAQRMLELPERVNMIQALECNCASIDRLAEIEAEISNVLGSEVQVIELSTKAIARAKARNDVKESGQRTLHTVKESKERTLSTLEDATFYGFGLLTVVSSLILAMMFLRNALQRVGEIGILMAIGVTRNQIALLFVAKAFVLGIVGGIVGFAAGVACLTIVGPIILNDGFTWPFVPSSLPALVMIGTPVITMLATWIPIEFVTGRDPSRILQEAS